MIKEFGPFPFACLERASIPAGCPLKTMEDTNSWECPACTYKNGPESYRCLMCDFRKGTSTRKPRINPEMMAKQVARQQEQIKQQVLKASATKTKTIASEKSAFRRVDDTNSNSSIASNGSSGRLSPLANSNCSTSQDSPNCTANTSLSFGIICFTTHFCRSTFVY